MDYIEFIKYNINKLVTLKLIKGVQISELVNNIYSESYNNINIYKKNEEVFVEISFNESNSKIYMTYVYNNDKDLVRIIEQTNNKTVELWSRKSRVEEIIHEINFYLNKVNDISLRTKIISGLSEEIKEELVYANISII